MKYKVKIVLHNFEKLEFIGVGLSEVGNILSNFSKLDKGIKKITVDKE